MSSILIIISSCASHRMTTDQIITESLQCSSEECEVEKYEAVLSVLGKAENDLSNGNSFKALRNLEIIREHASYHGKFKSIYKVAAETCIASTNKLASREGLCSLVRERIRFIKNVAPEKLLSLDVAIRKCNVDIGSNSETFKFEDASQIELSRSEATEMNLHDTIQGIRKKYNSYQWEKLLLIDLKILAGYRFKLGKPELQKEMPRPESVRFIIPISISFNGDKDSYCSQYKAILHDNSFSTKRNCFDYPNASDFVTRSPPVRWTNNTYITEIQVTNAVNRSLKEIPLTKGYQKTLSLEIAYNSKQALLQDLDVELPGDFIPQNFLARMAYTQSLENKFKKTYAPEIILNAHSRAQGISLSLRHSRYFGFEIILDVPIELTRDFLGFGLKVPVKSIHDHYHMANSGS